MRLCGAARSGGREEGQRLREAPLTDGQAVSIVVLSKFVRLAFKIRLK